MGKINAGIHPGGQGESYRVKSKNRSARISYVPVLRFRRAPRDRIELVPIAEESEGISLDWILLVTVKPRVNESLYLTQSSV